MKNVPMVAIIGRPNVGKSTLFNALVGARKALVWDEPGVTQNVHKEKIQVGRTWIELVDTGGCLPFAKNLSALDQAVQAQVTQVFQRAEVLLFVLDGREGLTHADQEILDRLRKQFAKTPTLCVVNKIDTDRHEERLIPFYEIGGYDVCPISAETRRGMEGLGARLEGLLMPIPERGDPEDPSLSPAIRLAIVGRPNVGKSTLMNWLAGEEVSLVSTVAGTTRDVFSTTLREEGSVFEVSDTAGIRRRGKTKGLDTVVVQKTMEALEHAFVAILVVDLAEGVTDQDCRIAGLVHESGRGLLVFGNKLDLAKKKMPRVSARRLEAHFLREIRERMPFVQYAPVVLGSAIKGQVSRQKLWTLLKKIESARKVIVSTHELNRYLRTILDERPLPMRAGKRLKVFYAIQAVAHHESGGMRPARPAFVCFVNDPRKVHFSDERFLCNALRKRYPFFGNPISLTFRASKPESTLD